MFDEMVRPATAPILERWRLAARLSKQRLADLADVSATYIRTIEAGVDDDGRPVVPSAGVMRRLARGLALAEADPVRRAEVEQRAYAELMAAAGYLPPSEGEHGLAEPPAPCVPNTGLPVTVTLRDPRLLAHARALLEDWESLSAEDQTLLLGMMEYVDARRRRAPSGS